jgi:predicted DNA binding protein
MRTNSLRLIALVLLAITLPACSTTYSGVTNRMGTYEAYVDAAPDEVVTAAVAASEHLMLTVESSAASKLDGRVDARTAEDRKVVIRTANRDNGISRVSVRVGSWGDASMSMVVLKEIREKLAKEEE